MMYKTILSAIITVLIVSRVQGTSISNLNVIFETFSPLSMVRFFEFNDIGWNISEKCVKDMFLYLDGLHKDVLWATKLYDSSGYYAGGIYAGNNLRHVDPQLCRELNNDYTYHEYRLKYGANQTVHEDVQTYLIPSAVLPFLVRLVNVRYKTIIESSPFHSYIIHQTACMPISCNHNDLLQVMSYANVLHLRNNLIMKNAQLLDIRILKQSYRPNMDISFHWLIAITAVFLFLGLFGTVLEYCMNFDVKINLIKVEHKNSINATVAQLTNNHLNDITNCSYKYCQNTPNMIDQLNSSNSNFTQDMSLFQSKEFKVDNFSTIHMDSVKSKCSQCSQCNDYFPTKQIRIDTQRFHHYSEPNSFGGTSLHTPTLDCGWIRQFLLAFSWRRNYETLFSVVPKDCINEPIEISGLRVFALCWILMVHVCTVLYFVSDNKMYKMRHEFNVIQEFIAHGILAFDFHFFLCGICIAHMFFKRIQRIDVERICSCFDTFVHIILMIMYKVFSMSVPYLITLCSLQICMKYFHDFSIIDIPTMDHKTCEQNMWHNIFFIDQFYPLEQRCMIWSWVLSIEVQCFIVASVILLISTGHPRFGIIIFSSFLICAIVAMTTVNGHDHGNSVNSSLIVHENLASFNSLYEKPWARISPYIFGICVGYVLHKISRKIEISLIVIICGWIACCFLIIVLILSKLSGTSSSSSSSSFATFSTMAYAMWTLIVLWLIIASNSKHRGVIGRCLTSKYLLPFNKISNCFLMLHPLVTRFIILSSDTAMHLSVAMIVTFYLGVAVITIFFSFLLYIIYGAPIDQLLRIVYNRNIKY